MSEAVVWTDNLERDLANLTRLSAEVERKILDRMDKVDSSFEKLKEEHPTVKTFPNKINLDVGGQIFRTTVEVLTKEESFFSSMFSGVFDLETDPFDDSYFIDRSPKYFGYILEYCRTGKIKDYKKLPRYDKHGLLAEVEFYGMKSLFEYLGGGGPDYSEMHWDPRKMSSGITLSNNNMTAVSTGGCSHKTVLGSEPIEGGCISWEVRLNQDADCYSAVGLVGEGFNYQGNATVGSAPNSWGMGMYPNIATGTYRAQAVNRLRPGQIVKCVYDMDEGTFKISVDGQERGNWSNVVLEKAYICLTVCELQGGGYTLQNVESV
jgi:hypothetical protein